jgi:hypothetical protein
LSSSVAHLQAAYSVDVISAIVVAQVAAPAMRAAGVGKADRGICTSQDAFESPRLVDRNRNDQLGAVVSDAHRHDWRCWASPDDLPRMRGAVTEVLRGWFWLTRASGATLG